MAVHSSSSAACNCCAIWGGGGLHDIDCSRHHWGCTSPNAHGQMHIWGGWGGVTRHRLQPKPLGLHVAECTWSGNPTTFRLDSGRDWRQGMVASERHSSSGNGCRYEPHEDGCYHAGTQHDLRLTPWKVTQLGPGFHPGNRQCSGCRQWTPNLSNDPLMLQQKPWRLDHPTCPLGIHRQPCTTHESLVNTFSPSALKHWNFFSSPKATWYHNCRVQRWQVRHQATWAWRCLWVSTDSKYGHYGRRFLQLRDDFGRFLGDTGRWCVPVASAAVYVAGRSLSHTRCVSWFARSCTAVITRGRPDLAQSLLELGMQ